MTKKEISLLAAVAVYLVVIFVAMFLYQRKNSPQAKNKTGIETTTCPKDTGCGGGGLIATSGTTIWSTGSFPGNLQVDATKVTTLEFATPEDEKSLTEAMDIWDRALSVNGITVHTMRPTLFRDKGGLVCKDGALACALMIGSPGSIFIVEIPTSYDETTILLHEVGHILGVPHIEDDALMNSWYKGKLTAPTKFAIAIARATDKGRVTIPR